MNVYTCNDHAGRWPVGACSIVVAENETKARALLEKELHEADLDTHGFTLELVDTTTEHATVLLDGDY